MPESDQDQRLGWDFEAATMPYVDSLYNTAYRLTRNAADAEDLVQEAYLKAYRHYDKFQEGTNLKAWLFKIMKNTFINNYRKNQRVPPQSDFAELEQGGLEGKVREDAAGRIKDPEEEFLATIVDEQVQEALDSLSEDYRMAVILADLENFSYKEIAEILEVPVGTVMSRLYRGRKQLEEVMLEYARSRGYLRSGEPRKSRGGSSSSEGDGKADE